MMMSIAVLSLLLFLGGFFGISWTLVITADLAFLLLSLLDLILSPRKKEISVRREMPDEMERALEYDVQVKVSSESKHAFSYKIVDGIPQSFERPFPLQGSAGEGTSTLLYKTAAPVRGQYAIEKLFLRYRSKLGLWEKQKTFTIEESVKVIPDLTDTKRFLEDAQQFLIYEGMKIRRMKSGAGEFSKIRNYAVGDDPRMINWRQTAKLREVMTNEYEPEHGKYITVLIDCGRMMGAELTKGNRLERALEAAMTVSAAALQKGDYVSVLAFSKDVKVFVPPAKGMAHLQTILQSIYNLEVDSAESNYAAVLSYLQNVQKKRSLLLLFSDVGSFLHEGGALTYLHRLRQRHLFLMLGIEDRTVLNRAGEEPESIRNTMIKSMAQKQLLIKKREKVKWEKRGLQMAEAREEKLAAAAVSHYIDIMNRGLL
ncbi:DUF58 domain-containing protein [Bacillus salacetis]|uniref:DUF58 domain-containing protein n=2 Tax=Bacillus salacetis TaxID=2315464 RepID=A0A3A1QW95_9BACI|nr:DUF58 domain-containing protein [Bacillus salacetis]